MRVYIRKPQVSDAREFVKKTKDSLAMHRPWVHPATSLGGFYTYLDRISESRHEGFLVCLKQTDEIAGLVNLNEIVLGALQSAYVGYWLADGFQGKGLMSEGLALVFDHAFTKIGLHRLEINIQPSNTRSTALAERLGLTREGFSMKYLKIGGEWKDHERWAMISEEWLERGGSEWAFSNLNRTPTVG